MLGVLPSLLPSDLFLAKAHKYFEDRNLTDIVNFLFLSSGKKEEMNEDF